MPGDVTLLNTADPVRHLRLVGGHLVQVSRRSQEEDDRRDRVWTGPMSKEHIQLNRRDSPRTMAIHRKKYKRGMFTF